MPLILNSPSLKWCWEARGEERMGEYAEEDGVRINWVLFSICLPNKVKTLSTENEKNGSES